MKQPSSILMIMCVATLLIPAKSVRGAEEPNLPTRVVLTDEDCKNINEKGNLRGRDVNLRTEDKGGVWDGLQVFTGRKSDVINWFISGQQGLTELTANKIFIGKRFFQYDLLCSELIQTGDVDIIRAVLWHARRFHTGYVNHDWRKLLNDPRLTVPERIVVWRRTFDEREQDGIKLFWELFGDTLRPEHILEVYARNPHLFTWAPFVYNAVPVPAGKRIELVTPLLIREYLSVGDGNLIRGTLRCLNRLTSGADRAALANIIVDIVEQCDKLGDERCEPLWDALIDLRNEPKLDRRLRDFLKKAQVPGYAARAFYAFAGTLAGRQIVGNDKSGWQQLYEEYLQLVFSKTHDNKDIERSIRFGFLEALTGHVADLRTYTGFVKNDRFIQTLKEGKVLLVVPEEQKELILKAWHAFPEAAEHVKTKE